MWRRRRSDAEGGENPVGLGEHGAVPLSPRRAHVFVDIEQTAGLESGRGRGETGVQILHVVQGLVNEGRAVGTARKSQRIQIPLSILDAGEAQGRGPGPGELQGVRGDVDAEDGGADPLGEEIALQRSVAAAQADGGREAARPQA